ncbi:MAG: helix-hairpin-helix domain-containing protein, partial [Candidatus Hydrothermarchaeota archaeon]|nr:helix-hairpin-helix domain-containing protein [Candidatus Hydrothermarchaeota archaeon]
KKVKVPLKRDRVVPLKKIAGVGPKREERLREAGIKSANKMRKMNIEKVHKATGIPKKILEGYVEAAKKLDYGRDTPAKYILRESLEELDKTFSDIKAKFKGAS